MKKGMIIGHLRRLKKEVDSIQSGNLVHKRNYVSLELELLAQLLEKEE